MFHLILSPSSHPYDYEYADSRKESLTSVPALQTPLPQQSFQMEAVSFSIISHPIGLWSQLLMVPHRSPFSFPGHDASTLMQAPPPFRGISSGYKEPTKLPLPSFPPPPPLMNPTMTLAFILCSSKFQVSSWITSEFLYTTHSTPWSQNFSFV